MIMKARGLSRTGNPSMPILRDWYPTELSNENFSHNNLECTSISPFVATEQFNFRSLCHVP